MSEPGQVEVEVRASAGSKRVAAPRPLAPPPAAAPLHRELLGPHSTEREHRWRSFAHFALQQEWDLYCADSDGAAGGWWPPFYLRRRTAVREVVAAPGLVIALADSGVCAAFNPDSGRPLCFINCEADEVVRSLFVNRLTDCLITVSVFAGDANQQLRVRSTPLSGIRAGRPHAWRSLFGSEVLRWPGFVEFDDVNDVVVTCSAQTRRFKVYDLRAPHHPRFHLDSTGIQDIKIASGGVLLLTLQPQRRGELALRVLDLADGSCLKELCLPLASSRGPAAAAGGCDGGAGGGGSSSGLEVVEVVELFGRHLLVKEAGGPLLILDITSGAARHVPATDFPAPAAFIHLPFNHSFLSCWQTGHAQLWSFEGRRLASLPHVSLPTAAAINTIYVADAQDLMWVYCPPGCGSGSSRSRGSSDEQAAAAPAATASGWQELSSTPAAAGSAPAAGLGGSSPCSWHCEDKAHLGCIRVFDLLTGRQVAVLQAPPQQAAQPQQQPSAGGKRQARLATAAAAALRHLTSLYYDAHSHRIFTGSANGRVQAWGIG